MTEISIIAVVAAAMAHMALGFAWYHPRLFGSAWMRLSSITPEMIERGAPRMPLSMAAAFAAALAMAYLLSAVLLTAGQGGVGITVDLFSWAFMLWLGFIVPVLLGSVLWEMKPWRLFLINASYWLVSLIVMASFVVLLS